MTSQKGLSVNVVGREVMVDTEGFYEYAAAPGILGSEVSDLLESRFYGPQSLLWIEDADLPKVEEVSGHLLKELFHGRGSFGGGKAPRA